MAKRLYIIHGWTYGIKPWEPAVKDLREAGIEVVQLKVPGLTYKSDKLWTIDDYVEWLKGELSGEKNPIVLGHSNGGRIALNYITKYPGKLSHLILLDSAGVYDASTSVSMKRKVLKALSKALKPLKKVPLFKKVVYRLIGASDYNLAPPNMKATLVNMINSDKNLELDKVKVQTTILWGLDDKTTPIWQGRKMHQLIAGSELTEFEGWRHSPYITHPKDLAKAIIKTMENL